MTRNRRQWLPQAIACYQAQSYARRELLILSDGEDVRDLVPLDDPSIRLLHLEGRPEIGAKRNFGCERAAGEVIAHWDDDDYSAPGRLSDQVERLCNSGLAVTGYRSMRFTDGVRSWLWTGTIPAGTSLCYRRDWWQAHKFPAKQIAEDVDFGFEAMRARQLIAVEAGELMYATNHAGNTSPRALHGENWKAL